MNLLVYNETIFLLFLRFFTDQNLMSILNKKILLDDGLLSEPTTEVNGNDEILHHIFTAHFPYTLNKSYLETETI